MEHIAIYKTTELHSSFPHVIRLQNGDLLTSFRQDTGRVGGMALTVDSNLVSKNLGLEHL